VTSVISDTLIVHVTYLLTYLPCYWDRSGTLWWLCGLTCPLASRKHPSCNNNGVPDLETAFYHHAVTVPLLFFYGEFGISRPVLIILLILLSEMNCGSSCDKVCRTASSLTYCTLQNFGVQLYTFAAGSWILWIIITCCIVMPRASSSFLNWIAAAKIIIIDKSWYKRRLLGGQRAVPSQEHSHPSMFRSTPHPESKISLFTVNIYQIWVSK